MARLESYLAIVKVQARVQANLSPVDRVVPASFAGCPGDARRLAAIALYGYLAAQGLVADAEGQGEALGRLETGGE